MKVATTDEIVLEIKTHAEGLMFLSEAEFPIHVFCCETEEPLLQYPYEITGRHHQEVIEESSLTYLYRNLNTLQEINNLPENEHTKKYKLLIDYITEHLINLKVYKIGEEEIDIIIIGSTESGKYITLTTKSVETS